MTLEALQAMIETNQAHMLATLEELVSHETPSTDKASLDLYAARLADHFAEMGCETEVIPNEVNGAHLKVTYKLPGISSGRPGLLLCHSDTVWSLGTIEDMPFHIEGGKAFGPGIYDMKASHVMVEWALRSIAELGMDLPRPLEILFTSDEEIGSPSSRALIEEQALGAEYVLVLEPPTAQGALKTSRKGVGGYDLQIKGRASHAGGQPELGISAITELAQQILLIQGFADLEQGTTVSVGVVRGGTRTNVIAAQAEARIDVRAWTPQEARRIEQAMAAVKPITPGAQIKVEGGFERPPLVRTKSIADLFERVRGIGEQLGLNLQEGSTGGGSDGNFTAALGVATLDGLGVMGDGAHADHEHILLADLPARTGLLAAVLVSL